MWKKPLTDIILNLKQVENTNLKQRKEKELVLLDLKILLCVDQIHFA